MSGNHNDPVVIVGGGHNGLVAGCYLAKAGRRVLVLEAADRLGGGSRTDETIPGYRFNTHSAAHNIINMTSIPGELDLAGAGLEYIPMEPFATGFFRDGRIVRSTATSSRPSPRSPSTTRPTPRRTGRSCTKPYRW